MKNISIFGMGYIGLPTAIMFAESGIKVNGIDTNQEVCESINKGQARINEPGLKVALTRLVFDGLITCSTKVKSSEVFIISVPTPLAQDKKPDLSCVKAAAQEIVHVLKSGDLVILESTVPPKTTDDVLRPLLEKTGLLAGVDFGLAYCPERVLPGNIMRELKSNSRVIGGIDEKSAIRARDLFAVFVEGDFYLTDTITAEICKLMENTYRDVNIALVNELSMLCEKLGANVWEVVHYANKHPRVHLHNPGPGVGGHCLPIDPWFVVDANPEASRMIKQGRQINSQMPRFVFEKVTELLPVGSRIVIMGYTYKPNVGDLRESPIITLKELLEGRYEVTIVDPFVSQHNIDIYEAANNADMLLLGVDHDSFADIDLLALSRVMRRAILFDTRDFFRRTSAEEAGFEYHLLGDGLPRKSAHVRI